MNRYYDTMAWVAGIFCILMALWFVVEGSYFLAFICGAIAVLMFPLSKNLHEKELRMLEREANPISANRKRLEDEKIIQRIKNDTFDPVNGGEKPKQFQQYKIKNDTFDPVNPQLKDVEKGSLVDYQLKTWAVDKVRFLYWLDGEQNHQLSKYVQLNNQNDRIHAVLHHEHNNDQIPVTKKVNIFSIDSQMETYASSGKFTPPTTLAYQGESYFREAPKRAYSIDPKDLSYTQLISYDYFNQTHEKLLRLNYWGQQQIEAEAGQFLPDRHFSNILPAPDTNDHFLIDN